MASVTRVLCFSLCLLNVVLCQYGYFPSQSDRYQNGRQFGFGQNFFPVGKRVLERLANIVHFGPDNPKDNSEYILVIEEEDNKPQYNNFGRPNYEQIEANNNVPSKFNTGQRYDFTNGNQIHNQIPSNLGYLPKEPTTQVQWNNQNQDQGLTSFPNPGSFGFNKPLKPLQPVPSDNGFSLPKFEDEFSEITTGIQQVFNQEQDKMLNPGNFTANNPFKPLQPIPPTNGFALPTFEDRSSELSIENPKQNNKQDPKDFSLSNPLKPLQPVSPSNGFTLPIFEDTFSEISTENSQVVNGGLNNIQKPTDLGTNNPLKPLQPVPTTSGFSLPTFEDRFGEIATDSPNGGQNNMQFPSNFGQNNQFKPLQPAPGFSLPIFEDKFSETTAGNLQLATKLPELATVPPAPTGLPELTPVPVFEARDSFNYVSEGPFKQTCRTIEGEVGSCISIYECQSFLEVLKKFGSSPAVAQMLRKAHCGFDGSNPKVCCPRPGIPTAPPTPPVTTTTTTTTTQAPFTEAPVTKSAGDPVDFIAALPEPPECGVSNASLGRVVGGYNAKLGDFPWMALLGYTSRRGSGTRWLCGGTLISPHHTLTAAHCVHGRETDLYVVRLGELDLARDDDGAFPVDVLIKNKIKHENYDANSYTNDIAILVLDKDIPYSDLIRPICLPKTQELRSLTFVSYNPIIAGWGDTEFRGLPATHLQALQLPVVSNEFCANAYRNYKAQKIDERVLCAGYEKGGKDACQGDSGGPLMQPIWNRQDLSTAFYQIGVVSFGRKCAEAGFPGVYTRVTNFIPWIEEKILGVALS